MEGTPSEGGARACDKMFGDARGLRMQSLRWTGSSTRSARDNEYAILDCIPDEGGAPDDVQLFGHGGRPCIGLVFVAMIQTPLQLSMCPLC